MWSATEQYRIDWILWRYINVHYYLFEMFDFHMFASRCFILTSCPAYKLLVVEINRFEIMLKYGVGFYWTCYA